MTAAETGWTWTSRGTAATFAFGQALGALLRAGDFVALTGQLGAGKTHLVKGLAVGLGVAPDEPVVSPTFVLVREYFGRLKLYHIDAYRLGGTAELLALGLEEMSTEAGSVVAIEWADRTPEAVPAHACRVTMEHAGEEERQVRVDWADTARLAELQRSLPQWAP
jgi:tRNA threonylcarbamoyladenosine biosynthesis protein TsaE